MDEKTIRENIDAMRNILISHVPFAQAIGMEIIDAKTSEAWMRVPYSDKLIGNPDTGVIHGGVITATLDNVSGVAVQLALPERMAIATLDLRIDYMRPATPGEDLTAHAHCYKVTRNIAFVRSTAYHDDVSDPIATSVGAFMLAANRAQPPGPDVPEDLTRTMKKED
ncbi:MAG: PaaI family thioesterase [Alphaproteobacteria bacterium]|nr:PaaI family thioesterase [Alphaproteobacteria bacterium]MBO6628758.1 PaaI family thioesterase [Alphaproteobacteria bacterium]MDF1627360.1 PaaI family thioesterase [Parvibaculaceae bacterium]